MTATPSLKDDATNAPFAADAPTGQLWPVYAITLLFLLICLPAILLGKSGTDGLAQDALSFHIPQINNFLQNPYDLFHYEAKATTLPLYHWLIGVTAKLAGITSVDNGVLLPRLVHFLLSFIGPLTLAIFVARRTRPLTALLLTFPLITSWYVTSGAIYFGTDGPGLSASTVFLITLLTNPALLALGVLAILVAAARHLYVPLAIGAVVTEWLGRPSLSRAASYASMFIPACAILGLYFVIWGGLTPPGGVAELNPKGLFPYTILGHLSVAALWGVCFLILKADALGAVFTDKRFLALLTAVLVMVVALWLLSESSFSIENGRFGSIAWRLATLERAGSRSLAVLALSLVGAAAILTCGTLTLKRGFAPTEMGALVCFLAALTLTYASYQRYFEPICILAFAVVLSRIIGTDRIPLHRFVPLVLLSLLGLLTTVYKLYLS